MPPPRGRRDAPRAPPRARRASRWRGRGAGAIARLKAGCVAWAALATSGLRLACADVDFPDFRATPGLRMVGAANRTQAHLRLTPSRAGLAGCAWYAVKQQVHGGFVADFAVRVSAEPDQSAPGPCRHVGESPEHCVRRGGDGLAFVLQNSDEHALGGGGGELGYGGIANALAVELDTSYDASLGDNYGRHAAVLTGGRGALSSHHASAVGATTEVPPFDDGAWHAVRVAYDAEFRADAVVHRSFRAQPHLVALMAGTADAALRDADVDPPGELFAEPSGAGPRNGPRRRQPLGVLSLFVDDMADAVLTVPANVGAHLGLDHGRAWVGFCAATGAAFANHDVGHFRFSEGRSRAFETSSRAGSYLRADLDVPGRSGSAMELDVGFVRRQNDAFETASTYELSGLADPAAGEPDGGPDDRRSVA